MSRLATLIYGLVVYLLFLAVFLYLIGFLWSLGVPKGINDGEACGPVLALLTNLLLVSLFGVQHSVMARPGFKQLWTTVVPPAAERSTFVLLSSACLAALFCWWQPLPGVLWDVRGSALGGALMGVSAFGWGLVLLSTFVIDHFALFGVKQSLFHYLGRELRAPEFVVRGPYHLSRHPLMLGFLIAFWATPWMTVGHALFAAAMTGYILIALRYEERDLHEAHGDDYAAYTRRTSMLIPRPFFRE